MKNIAILTLYYNNYNYGGLLQAFALQQAINTMGYDSVQISYRLETGYSGWSPFKSIIKKTVAYIFHQIKYGRWFNKYLVRQKKLNLFVNQIPHTEVVTASTIKNLIDRYDCFICGSDQIWNPIGWQPTFFLDFVPDDKVKISYAASIARDNLTKEQLEYIRKFTSDFSAISVREKNSADVLNKSYPELNVQYIPDPVFLLEETEWMKLVKSNKSVKPFIFAYFLGDDDSNREKALTYARNTGLKIIFASHLSISQYQWEKEHLEVISSPLGVEEFLSHIANAELVITDSFHAMAFSAIYKTPFYVLHRFSIADKNSMNSRVVDLVEELQIPNRFTEDLFENYEWSREELDNISSNINRMRCKGLNYLDKSLCAREE